MNFDEYIQMSYAMQSLREPVLRSAVETLGLPPDSRGLDAGCSIGLQTLLLAEAVGPGGHITGLDVSSKFLEYASKMVKDAGLSDRISFREGNVKQLPFEDNTFDWVWSVDLVGYAPMDPVPLLKELVRVVKPGGLVAILAWSSEKLLPGYPVLEAHLNATNAGIAPFVKGQRPGRHFSRALGWFRELNLQEATAQTFAGSACAPLSKNEHAALLALFEMRWPGVEDELSPDDHADFRRLCLPESPDFIVGHRDYYAYFTYSMFHGRVPL